MKDILLTTLRNKKTSTADFRKAANDLATILAHETTHCLSEQKTTIQTPLAKTIGYKIKDKVILVPILRAGLALLPEFLKTFPDAPVGFIGLKRDEKTYEAKFYPHTKKDFYHPTADIKMETPYYIKPKQSGLGVWVYYKNIPKISPKDNVIILDPMLATGGSLVEAIKILIGAGARPNDCSVGRAKEEKIIYVGVVSAPEGLANLKKHFPKVKTIIAAHDKKLNKNKYILPGLGDFGNRYFKTGLI